MVIEPGRNLEDYAVILSDKDNVATALADLPACDYMLDRGEGQAPISVREDIKAGFKLALSDIGRGDQVYKYGYVIGLATQDIEKGNCVHVHNLISSV
jgi:altronate dehydratase small subunit